METTIIETAVGPPASAPVSVGEVKALLQQYLGGIDARLDTIESRLVALETGGGGAISGAITVIKDEVKELRGRSRPDASVELVPEILDADAPEKKWDVFISHTKRTPGSEQKALMISDCIEEAGMKPFIDLQNLEEISREQLISDVKGSKCLVTVIDPEVFNSEWSVSNAPNHLGIATFPTSLVRIAHGRCLLENATAVAAGIPIIPFYDGEAFKWNDISFWVAKHPDFFKIPAIEYHKGYHKQAKALLIAKARGEKLSGLNSALAAMTDVVGRAAKSTAIGMRVRLEVGSLPPSSGKLARSTAFLADEVGGLPPSATEHDGVNDALGDLRGCLEELDDELQRVMDKLPPPSSGAFGCGGNRAPMVAPAPVEVVERLMSKDVEMAKLRAALKDALHQSRRTARLQKRTSISSMSALLRDTSSASWDEFVGVLVSDLRAAGAEDEEVASAAEKAAALVPKLKSKLVDAATGQLKAGLVQKMLGTDAAQVLIDAAEVSSQVERVYYPEVKLMDATTGTVREASFGDLGFVMVREGASLSMLRSILSRVLSHTAFGPTAVSGGYMFYLHDGRTLVAANEEAVLLVFDHVPGLILVPTAPGARNDAVATGAAAEAAAVDELLCEAQAEEEAAARGAFAARLTLDDVLADPELVLRFKRVTYASGLAEENTSFLTELLAVRTACQGLDGAAARALALPRLRTIATVYLVKNTSMTLAVDEAVKASAVAAFTTALTGDERSPATKLFAAFEPVEVQVRAACERDLGALRTAVTTAGALRTIGKARRTVVVVGGGVAGSLIARWFDRHHNEKLHVVLVDPKEYHECTLAILRAVIHDGEDFQRRVRCPHAEYVRNGTFIMDSCQEVAPDHIKVGSSAAESSVVPFDFLILATGCFYAEGIKTASPSMEYRIRQYAAERRKVATAKRVLIIGAGVVGTELCGEIVDAFPDKEIIMVGRSTILSRCGPEAHRLIAQHWAERGVKCYFHEEMQPYKAGDTHYETIKGTRIPVDGTRTFWCTGRDTPNSGASARLVLRTSLVPPASLTHSCHVDTRHLRRDAREALPGGARQVRLHQDRRALPRHRRRSRQHLCMRRCHLWQRAPRGRPWHVRLPDALVHRARERRSDHRAGQGGHPARALRVPTGNALPDRPNVRRGESRSGRRGLQVHLARPRHLLPDLHRGCEADGRRQCVSRREGAAHERPDQVQVLPAQEGRRGAHEELCSVCRHSTIRQGQEWPDRARLSPPQARPGRCAGARQLFGHVHVAVYRKNGVEALTACRQGPGLHDE